MADEKVLKPKSFRIDDETAEKFKEISSNIGGNQQETLAKLIEAWEFQSGKAILTEKKSDIDQFEKYITAITRMYMSSLEDNQNLTAIVRTEFEALLQSKDAIIQDLQSQVSTSKQLKEEAVAKAKTYADENKSLSEYIDRLQRENSSKINNMQDMLSDKDSLNRALTDSCNNLKMKIDTMIAEHEEVTALQKNIATITSERDALKQGIIEAEKTLERVKAEMQIAQDKAALEIERKYQEQIQHLKEEKQAEIDRYQQKYFDLLEVKNQDTTH